MPIILIANGIVFIKPAVRRGCDEREGRDCCLAIAKVEIQVTLRVVPSRQQFNVVVLKSRRNENALRQKALKRAEVSDGSRQRRTPDLPERRKCAKSSAVSGLIWGISLRSDFIHAHDAMIPVKTKA
jgi:hypothetical protein